MITVSLDRRDLRRLDTMLRRADQRIERGEELLLLELATVLRRAVQDGRPQVPGRQRPVPYARSLRVGGVAGAPGVDGAVAVWLERGARELRADELMHVALIIRPKEGAPSWVHVLAAAGPWPADLLPVAVGARQARVVARRVRPDEAQALRGRLWDQRRTLARSLQEGGAPAFTWGTSGAAGMRVYVDLAWEALRGEFGWSDAPARPAWRRALKVMVAHLPVVARKLAQYLVDGQEARFDVGRADDVSWRKVKAGVGFQRELMPFVPRRAK